MKVKIVANGEPCGTRVLTEDGTDITDFVTAVVWRHEGAGSIPTAKITIGLVQMETAGVARMLAPNGKAVRRIEYEDGTEDEFPPNAPKGYELHAITPLEGRTRKYR